MSVHLDGTITVATKEVGGATDLTGKEGYCALLSADKIVLSSSVDDWPAFVITAGGAVGSNASIGMGPCRVWISEAVTAVGQALRAHTDGTWQVGNASADEVTAIALEVSAINTFCRAYVFGVSVKTL
jgi:hypothetical protein